MRSIFCVTKKTPMYISFYHELCLDVSFLKVGYVKLMFFIGKSRADADVLLMLLIK